MKIEVDDHARFLAAAQHMANGAEICRHSKPLMFVMVVIEIGPVGRMVVVTQKGLEGEQRRILQEGIAALDKTESEAAIASARPARGQS